MLDHVKPLRDVSQLPAGNSSLSLYVRPSYTDSFGPSTVPIQERRLSPSGKAEMPWKMRKLVWPLVWHSQLGPSWGRWGVRGEGSGPYFVRRHHQGHQFSLQSFGYLLGCCSRRPEGRVLEIFINVVINHHWHEWHWPTQRIFISFMYPAGGGVHILSHPKASLGVLQSTRQI